MTSIRRATEHLEDRDVAGRVLEDSGDTASDVLRQADRHDVDAMVLGGRKRSPVGKALLGSVSQPVVLETDRPVVVAGGGGE